jgi:hypothetical protein
LDYSRKFATFDALNEAEPKRGFRGGQRGFLV